MWTVITPDRGYYCCISNDSSLCVATADDHLTTAYMTCQSARQSSGKSKTRANTSATFQMAIIHIPFPCKLFAQLNIPISSSIGPAIMQCSSIPFRISLKIAQRTAERKQNARPFCGMKYEIRFREMSWNMFNKSAKGHTSSIIYLFLCLLRSTTESESRPSRRQKRELEILLSQSFFALHIYPFAAHIEEAKWDSNISALYLLFWTERRSSNYAGTERRAEISTSVTGFHNFALFCFCPCCCWMLTHSKMHAHSQVLFTSFQICWYINIIH